MFKIRCFTIILGIILLLQGCSPLIERAQEIFTDRNIDKNTSLEKVDFKPIQLDEIFLPVENVQSIQTKEQDYLKLEQVYGIDGDTLKAVAKKSDLEAFGIDSSTYNGTANSVSVTVRYLLIDTPESKHPTKAAQPYSKEASNRNNELLHSGTVYIAFDKGAKVDKYGRLLAYVYLENKMVQEILLKEGYARIAYIETPNITHLNALQAAEQVARSQNLNIWSIPDYVSNTGFND